MNTVTFRGLQCEEKPLGELEHWACSHVKQLLDGAKTGRPLSVHRILVGCNRSAEVFIFVSGTGSDLQTLEQSIEAPLTYEGARISCGSCWVDVYANDAL